MLVVRRVRGLYRIGVTTRDGGVQIIGVGGSIDAALAAASRTIGGRLPH
jgi:hypothetical protein